MMMLMEDLHSLLLQRNANETIPYASVHASNSSLRITLKNVQQKCDLIDGERIEFRERLDKVCHPSHMIDGCDVMFDMLNVWL